MSQFPLFKPQGEASLLVYLGLGIDPRVGAGVRALAARLAASPETGVLEIVPGYACLLIQFDPLFTDHEALIPWVGESLAALGTVEPGGGRHIEIPVVYGGEHGPDLDFVAQKAGLTPEEAVRRHTSADYPCYMVGFTPGFPFLGGLTPELFMPRLDNPRGDLSPGATGIGGEQTGLYPLGGPGGWRIMGRTPLMVYDPRRDPATLIRAGDMVRFRAVPGADFPDPPAPLVDWEPGRPAFQVLHPGARTTVQDRGRRGFQDMGVPLSGALDQTSLHWANLLAGNAPGAAALEMTILGPKLRALDRVTLAVCGADLGMRMDGKPAPPNRALTLEKGQVLSFSGPLDGARAVLALAGGLAAPRVMGSRSAYPLGLVGRPLEAGQILHLLDESGPEFPGEAPRQETAPVRGELTLRAVPGPNQDFFTPDSLEVFHGATWKVSQRSDRRGVRLEGPKVELRPGGPTSIVSEPNTPGIVQVPAGGEPIILLREQTTGGYAKIATVIGPDLDLLARALPGTPVRFRAVSAREGVEAARAAAAGRAGR